MFAFGWNWLVKLMNLYVSQHAVTLCLYNTQVWIQRLVNAHQNETSAFANCIVNELEYAYYFWYCILKLCLSSHLIPYLIKIMPIFTSDPLSNWWTSENLVFHGKKEFFPCKSKLARRNDGGTSVPARHRFVRGDHTRS